MLVRLLLHRGVLPPCLLEGLEEMKLAQIGCLRTGLHEHSLTICVELKTWCFVT